MTLKLFENLKVVNEAIYEKAIEVVEICSKKIVEPGDACDDAALIAQCTFVTAKEVKFFYVLIKLNCILITD